MIVDAVLTFISFLVTSVLDALPDLDTPGWFADIGPSVSEAVGYAGAMGAWLPLSLMGNVLVFVLVCVGIGFLIKIIRIVVSFLTVGGGSAG